SITDDIHVAYRPEPLRYLVEGNVTIIVNEHDVVVVDGSGSPEAARQVIEHIRELTPNPVSVLINTHGHGDHTLGNQEYVSAFPGIQIVTHPGTRAYMTGTTPGRGIDYVRQIARNVESRIANGMLEIDSLERDPTPGNNLVVANLRQYYEHDIFARQRAYGEVELTPATMTIEGRLVLHRGAREIQILFIGAGDTQSDLVVYLPGDRLVATGDMLVHPIPYGFSRQPLQWAKTLDSLATFDVDIMVPGHGDVLYDKSYLNHVRELLRQVRTQVTRGVGAGLDPDRVKDSVDLSDALELFASDDPVLRYYFITYFQQPNVARTYNDVTSN
ncbi:MAG: MBL fold metallo-hydrolase, partial [Gammaproteobacteria bacterium]|nr:MBL fold metallo-hydrolase [Gammaproteobacteria bacterium]